MNVSTKPNLQLVDYTIPASNREMNAEAERIVKIVEAEPDVREEIVASLRARIESGAYSIGSEMIAERMMERALGNQMG